ncbi:MAG: peptidylprolyl isomerase [Anaerolineae bacterium]|nr:MAG: peptidylprolyl isomerase [Anaerolineae bacterium]
MIDSSLVVDRDVVVSIDYVLTLANSEEIDRSDPGEPLAYLHGSGQIIPGLEKELGGLSVGDQKQVALSPSDGYGEIDPEEFITLPRDAFPSDMEMEVGEKVFFRESDDESEIEAYVAEIGSDNIKLDMNHPLAGETLHFDVTVVGLRPATSEELSHGHVHGHGHVH